jgi:hypothetical protein
VLVTSSPLYFVFNKASALPSLSGSSLLQGKNLFSLALIVSGIVLEGIADN